MVARWLGARALRELGERERAIRELYELRARLPKEQAPALRRGALVLGTRLLAADDRLLEAERWLRDLHQTPEGEDEGDGLDDTEVALLAQIAAARGDRAAASTLCDRLPAGEQWETTRVRVALLVDEPRDACERALAHLQGKPEDPERLRLWALSQVRAWGDRIEPAAARGVIEALQAASRGTPARLGRAHAHEIAMVALRADLLDRDLLADEIEGGARSGAAPEQFLLWVRAGLREGAAVDEAFESGEPVRLRAHPDLEKPVGPDELSPLRDPRQRGLEAQRALTIAERCVATGRRSQAEEALVEALVEMPQLGRAAQLLGELAPRPTSARLEDTLGSATELLASIPAAVLGVSLDDIPRALSLVVAARERLARPLTIAIMGEFSSGKSTFVNALLGEDVAPTGALPTTSTINVFRHGAGGRARVHYRDERISTLEREQVHPFLHGLDATEASRIRYVEIERAGARFGDAAVVDTPGLNALDPFHEKVAREFIEEADAVVWIFSATRSGAASEASMLTELREGGRKVLGILNKVDTLEGDEQQELSDYLREQLGEVLVGVVPLCATQALSWRTSGRAQGEDPFAAVDTALEREFLQRARELKRELTTRRFREALELARACVSGAIEALESRANVDDDRHDPARAARGLEELAQAVHEAVLDLDDVLVRECLALRVVSVDDGLRRELDARDLSYLDGALEDAALRSLRATLAAVPGELGPTLPALVESRFVPWARGYLAARTASRVEYELGAEPESAASLMGDLLRTHGREIKSGEAALRSGFRAGLRPMADDWRRELRAAHRELDWATFFARQQARSAPRAEALRLRSSILAGLDLLADRLSDDRAPGDRQPDPGT